MVLVFGLVTVRADEEKVPLDKVPKAVLEAVKKRFPKAEIVEAAKETADGKTEYEVTVKEAGKKIDVMLTPEGAITLIEKEIDVKDLPAPVKDALDKKYPKATYKIVEEVIKVTDGKEKLEYYEASLETADKKNLEVKVKPDGTFESEKEADELTGWKHDFTAEKDDLVSSGKNPYMILEPGYRLVLEGGKERLVITVLNETKKVDGVECRVVEERESKSGKLVEVSRNYYALSKKTGNVYYFGEEVDEYKDGKIVGHEGSWLSGEKGARFGMMMPGAPVVGAKYYQEVAPKVAMDRAEIKEMGFKFKTPAGEFKDCLKTEETTPLDAMSKGTKVYAPGIGLVFDGDQKLVKYGTVELPK
jgi:hypothetical protein